MITSQEQKFGVVRKSNTAWLILIGAGMFLLYLLTRSQRYDPEVLIELRMINHFQVTRDPAHPFFVLTGLPVFWLWKTAGYTGDALLPTQLLNAFWGAMALVLFAAFLYQLIPDRLLSTITTLGVGLSYAYWTHTTDSFFIPPTICFSIAALLCAAMIGDKSKRRDAANRILPIILGASIGLAILSYQASVALIPALMYASWPHNKEASRRTWLLNWCVTGMAALLIAVPVLVWQAGHALGLHKFSEIADWYLNSHGGMSEGLWRRGSGPLWRILPVAWIATILPLYEGMRLRDLTQGHIVLDRLPSQIGLILLIMLVFVIVVLLIVLWRRSETQEQLTRIGGIAGLWFLGQGSLVTWFDAAEVKLWIIPILAFWLLAYTTIGLVRRQNRKWNKVGKISRALLATTVAAIAIGNFLVPVLPNHSQPSPEMQAAQLARTHLHNDDLLISANFDWTLHADYLSDFYQDNFRVINLVAIAQYNGRAAVRPMLFEKIAQTHHLGGRVYVVDYFSPDKQIIWQTWITPYTHLVPDDLNQYSRQVAWEAMGEKVWELSSR